MQDSGARRNGKSTANTVPDAKCASLITTCSPPDPRLKALSSYTIVSSVVPYFGGPTMRYIYQVREEQRGKKTTLSQENEIHVTFIMSFSRALSRPFPGEHTKHSLLVLFCDVGNSMFRFPFTAPSSSSPPPSSSPPAR